MPSFLKFKCEALVDQGRYIGEDPVGHCCCSDAETTVYIPKNDGLYAVCSEHARMIETEPDRISFLFDGQSLDERVVDWEAKARSMLATCLEYSW